MVTFLDIFCSITSRPYLSNATGCAGAPFDAAALTGIQSPAERVNMEGEASPVRIFEPLARHVCHEGCSCQNRCQLVADEKGRPSGRRRPFPSANDHFLGRIVRRYTRLRPEEGANSFHQNNTKIYEAVYGFSSGSSCVPVSQRRRATTACRPAAIKSAE